MANIEELTSENTNQLVMGKIRTLMVNKYPMKTHDVKVRSGMSTDVVTIGDLTVTRNLFFNTDHHGNREYPAHSGTITVVNSNGNTVSHLESKTLSRGDSYISPIWKDFSKTIDSLSQSARQQQQIMQHMSVAKTND